MRVTIFRLLLVLAVLSPRVASASNAGCTPRRDRGVTEIALILAFGATATALVFRRSRIS
jgi:hypothetical protein